MAGIAGVAFRRSFPALLALAPIAALATAVAALALTPRRTTRLGGTILLLAYAVLCVAFYYSGDR